MLQTRGPEVGDVFDDSDDVREVSVGLAGCGQRDVRPDNRSILADIAAFVVAGIRFAPGKALVGSEREGVVLGMSDVGKRPRQQLLLGVPNDFAEAVVHADEPAVGSGDGHPHPRILEGETVTLLGFPKLLFQRGGRRAGVHGGVWVQSYRQPSGRW